MIILIHGVNQDQEFIDAAEKLDHNMYNILNSFYNLCARDSLNVPPKEISIYDEFITSTSIIFLNKFLTFLGYSKSGVLNRAMRRDVVIHKNFLSVQKLEMVPLRKTRMINCQRCSNFNSAHYFCIFTQFLLNLLI